MPRFFLVPVVLLSLHLLLPSCTPEPEPTGPVYLSEVFDYVYAPGQHASNVQPIDTQYVTGDPALHDGWLSLGGFGGYVIAGFPRDIVNEEGADFEVFALKGAAPEPAVVYVMSDANNNGRPDDVWYELKGSQFEASNRNYSLIYYKASSPNENIRWTDSEGADGEIHSYFGSPNSSDWWWSFTTSESITLSGTRLPDAYVNQPVEDTDFWSVPLDRFQWGYAENNQGTDYDARAGSNLLDISNAVDVHGQNVQLAAIRFIKIQTAVFQQAGQTNEVSAEIRGARSLR